MLTRREFVSTSLLAGLATVGTGRLAMAKDDAQEFRICVFEKFLQPLSYDELADVIAKLGFVGIEATVRKRGHVLPTDRKEVVDT